MVDTEQLGPLLTEFFEAVGPWGREAVEVCPQEGDYFIITWSYHTGTYSGPPFFMSFVLHRETAALYADVEGTDVEPRDALDTAYAVIEGI